MIHLTSKPIYRITASAKSENKLSLQTNKQKKQKKYFFLIAQKELYRGLFHQIRSNTISSSAGNHRLSSIFLFCQLNTAYTNTDASSAVPSIARSAKRLTFGLDRIGDSIGLGENGKIINTAGSSVMRRSYIGHVCPVAGGKMEHPIKNRRFPPSFSGHEKGVLAIERHWSVLHRATPIQSYRAPNAPPSTHRRWSSGCWEMQLWNFHGWTVRSKTLNRASTHSDA